MSGVRTFFVLLVLCGAVAALGGTMLWRAYGPSVREHFDEIGADAEQFAGSHPQSDCAPEALERARACDGLLCQTRQPIFTRICLRRAAHSPDLCEPLPDSLPLAFVWPQTACADIEPPVRVCDGILREVARVCLARRAVSDAP